MKKHLTPRLLLLIALFSSCFSKNKDPEMRIPIDTAYVSLEDIKKEDYSPRKYKFNCGCEGDTVKTQNTTSCDTLILKDKSSLYYQFNCDSVWLTFKNVAGTEKTIYSQKDKFDQLFYLNYRLGYHFAKEFKNFILFRTGCPANGPCNFVLLNKKTGKIQEELGELIYNHDDDFKYEFLIYFSGNYDKIVVDFIDTNKQITVPVNKEDFNATVPEYQFDDIRLSGTMLILTYDDKKTIKIDLSKY